MVWPAIIAAGGAIAGGLISQSGQSATNLANERIAKDNRAFQERMSSTAYQRAAIDLDKAGLNRILALGSPASSPGGSTAQMQNPKAQLGKSVSNAVTTALGAEQQAATIKNTEMDTTKKLSEANLIESQDAKVIQEILNLSTSRDLAKINVEIRNLEIPSVQAEADLWNWLNNAGSSEIMKAWPKVGPLLIPLFKMFLMKKGK